MRSDRHRTSSCLYWSRCGEPPNHGLRPTAARGIMRPPRLTRMALAGHRYTRGLKLAECMPYLATTSYRPREILK